MHERIDAEQRHALAVHRDLDLFLVAGRHPEEGADQLGVQHDPEDVVAVGREVVDDSDTAARAEGGALGPPQLRGGARHLVGRFTRRH